MTAASFNRVGPVHFQPLTQELQPVARYLSGHLLNAGAGTRDIGRLFAGVTKVTRTDVDSTDPGVVVSPLEALPFVDGTFDSVLCNAVLEHVVDAEQAIRELARVVRPGGHVVVAVPFLQPFHPCPGDFRRYTAAGLTALGEGAGLEVVEVLPVHSIAQTLGWILWEYAREKGGRMRRALAWSTAFVATRLWHRTDPTLIKNANTFQAVFRRPDVIGSSWRRRVVPAAIVDVPTMLVPDEQRLLGHLAESWWSGEGAIVDGGCFLGGSTVALAEGLRRSLRRRGLPEAKHIHSYDRFEVEGYTQPRFFPASTEVGSSFRARFDACTAPYRDLIEVHAGDIREHPWRGGPIEILFIDVAKGPEVCDWVTWQFFRHLIPGRSIVIEPDYLWPSHTAWLHVTMEHYAEYFTYLCDTGENSVAFLHTKQIPDGVLRERTFGDLDHARRIALMDRAASRFSGKQRATIEAAKAHYLASPRGP